MKLAEERRLASEDVSPRNMRKSAFKMIYDDSTIEKKKGKPKMWGVLGIDTIVDDKEMPGGTLTGKNMLDKTYAFGLHERLFTPEQDREKYKNRFNNFMKKLDVEIKINEKYLE